MTKPETKTPVYIIEYRYQISTLGRDPATVWSQWRPSKNLGAIGEHSLVDACRIANEQQDSMGKDYEYRVIPCELASLLAKRKAEESPQAPTPPANEDIDSKPLISMLLARVRRLAAERKAKEKLVRIQAVLNSKTKAEQIQDILND